MALQKHLARYRLLNLLVGIYSNIVCFKKKFLQGFFSLVILTKAVYKYTKFEKVELNYFLKQNLLNVYFLFCSLPTLFLVYFPPGICIYRPESPTKIITPFCTIVFIFLINSNVLCHYSFPILSVP